MEIIFFFIATIILSMAYKEHISRKSFVYVLLFPIFLYLIKETTGNDRIILISLVSLVQIIFLSLNKEEV